MGIDFKAKGCIATVRQIKDELEKHEILLSYHLVAFDQMIGTGDQDKQDEQLQLAANHAAIITALKSYPHEPQHTYPMHWYVG